MMIVTLNSKMMIMRVSKKKRKMKINQLSSR